MVNQFVSKIHSKIETLRKEMVDLANKEGFTSIRVISISQEIDRLHNILNRIKQHPHQYSVLSQQSQKSQKSDKPYKAQKKTNGKDIRERALDIVVYNPKPDRLQQVIG